MSDTDQHTGAEWTILPAEADARIPEIVRCWQNVEAVLPPSEPTNPTDPSTNLATLAAIAHAKWTKAEELESLLRESEAVRQQHEQALRQIANPHYYDSPYESMRILSEKARAALAATGREETP